MATSIQAATPLQFLPLSTSISPSFWHRLTDLKLHHLKLSDDPVPICGWYGRGKQVKDRVTGESVAISAGLELDNASFDAGTDVGASDASAPSERTRLRGVLRNFNTIEEFKNCDKAKLLNELGEQIWQQATSASSSSVTLESLNPFLLITFADLKKYRYYYWCGFPALAQKPGWEIVEEWREVPLPEPSSTPLHLSRGDESEAGALAGVFSFWANTPADERRIVLSDPSAHPSAPGWPLRNVLLFLSTSPTFPQPVTSLAITLVRDGQAISARIRRQEGAETTGEGKRPATVGWEKNEKGKLGPRMADLGPLMDPTRLADQAVDLNLQLMRWRIMPSLDLDKVKNTRCLLLGAGTLGCYVARTLMAWGVRNITLVDSSTVSFSNPVRQPLFEFEDSLNGGKPKAQTAAAALKRIYPGVDATGISLSIPMPGHPIPPTAQDAIRQDLETLERLVDEHDVVYLLMDSRESRWLPTLIGAAKGKLVMNVALGFDTFLVMRHGLPTEESAASTPAEIVPGPPYRGQLGCYYCNDVVAPMDSLSDRTLDQMCTVTRPGIASIASSTAVELMVSILQHPQGALAPSDIPASKDAPAAPSSSSPSSASPLGVVPHQIRGFLANFENLKITGHAYERCTGCSQPILDAYRADAFDLVRQSCEDAKYLERLTGLDKLEEETEALLAEGLDWDEEDEEAEL
ncbi:Ubiquitin-like modifier-activating enzyme ATG7 [Rhodotorula toruloides]|uniref:Ubiquitin-like modifier-activating enzyme ATG7 n=1 Tax=Rhodotorula toruloides TaxID=5286 RepID=A0A0K3CW82_RHOTO|nr:Ubiquitin-like modifier-activating enzyme ATG7 [Rhodotorula toruloides]PRQ69880.1 hypothetical protein AAT19DRAFT_11901 [Rhodotorula toruloides]